MRVRVPVSAELIARFFTTGYTTRGVVTVTEGLPPGSWISEVQPLGGDQVLFVFETPGELEGEETRSITVRHDDRAADLLRRFAELYGEVRMRGASVAPCVQLWREFYQWTGEHYVLTDEGWMPAADHVAGSEEVLEEVNAPAEGEVRS